MQPAQKIPMEHQALVTRGEVHQWAPPDNFCIRSLFQDQETQLIYLIHRNKHDKMKIWVCVPNKK